MSTGHSDGWLLHFAHEACADESIETGIALTFARHGVYGCVRLSTTELILEAGLPVAEDVEVFFGRERTVMSSGISFGLGSEQDAFSLGRSSFEAVLTLQFLAGSRVALPVARMADSIGFGSGLIDDATFVVAIGFSAVDDTAFAEGAADVADRVLVINSCHICVYYV